MILYFYLQSKKTYETKCKDKDSCEDAYNKNKMIAPPKETEKVSLNLDNIYIFRGRGINIAVVSPPAR